MLRIMVWWVQVSRALSSFPGPLNFLACASCDDSIPAAGADAPACSQCCSGDDDGLVIQVIGTAIFHNCAGDQSAFAWMSGTAKVKKMSCHRGNKDISTDCNRLHCSAPDWNTLHHTTLERERWTSNDNNNQKPWNDLPERDCFYDIIVQTYNAGLRSMKHPIDLGAGKRPSASTTCEMSRVLQCVTVAMCCSVLQGESLYSQGTCDAMTRKSESFLLQFVAVCCNMVMIEIGVGMCLGSSVMVYHLAPDPHLAQSFAVDETWRTFSSLCCAMFQPPRLSVSLSPAVCCSMPDFFFLEF